MAVKNSVLFPLVATCLAGCGALADLTTASIDHQSPARDPKAIELMDRVIAAHNFQKLENAETYSFHAKDKWKGFMTLMNPIPKDNQWMEMRLRTKSFDGQVQYLETKDNDVIHGVQSFRYYKKSEAKGTTFKENKKMVFAITAIQYLSSSR